MPEGATADGTEYTPYIDWRSDAEVTSLESISGKEAVVSEAPVENEISSTGTAPAAATALALTTMGAGAATTRPRLTANSTPEEIAAYYAWIEETKTASQAADATNQYWNYGDDDWTAAWNTGDPTADGAFIKTGAPAGLTYSVDDSRVTLHNNSTTDVAVVGLLYPDYSSQGVTVIRAGESYTIEESGSNPLGVNGYIVQTERQDGKPVLIGQITTMQSSLMPFSVTVAPVTSTHQQSDYILLQGTSVIDPSHADPGDRFVDQNEYLASIGSDGSPSLIRHFVNPEPAGVSYSKNSDGSTTIFNDGTDDIAISQSTTGGQILAFDILKPGQRATYTAVPGSPVSSVEVQAPRSHSNEYNVLGAVTFAYTVTGPVSSSPGNGIPAIPVHNAPLLENHAPGGTLEAQQKPANQRTMDYVAHVSDIDGDSLTYTIVKQPTNGVVTNHGDGTFTFTPTDPADLHDGVVGKPVTAWDLLAGDFTTMPDNSFVVEVSDGKGGSSRIGAIVYYMFTEEDNTPPVVTVTGGQSGVGEGAWTISIDDADGDRTAYYVGAQTTYGHATSATPYMTEDGVVHDDHLIFYTPDLVRAHQSAYDDTFTVTVNDGHYGGLVSTPVTVHVPFYNQNPSLVLAPTGGQPIRNEYGAQIGSITTGPTYVINTVTSDPDGDAVTLVSASTSNGGTVAIRDGKVYYTPKPSAQTTTGGNGVYSYPDTNGYNGVSYLPYYYDSVTVTVDDGHGGTGTRSQSILVANTASLPWVPAGKGVVLMITAGTEEARATSYVLDRYYGSMTNRTESAEAFVAMLAKYSLGSTIAEYPALLDAYLHPMTPGGSGTGTNTGGGHTAPGGQPITPLQSITSDLNKTLKSLRDFRTALVDKSLNDASDAVDELIAWFSDPSKLKDRITGLIGHAGPIGKVIAYSTQLGELTSALSAGDEDSAVNIAIGLLSSFARDVSKPGTPGWWFGWAMTTYQYLGEQIAETGFDFSDLGDTLTYAAAHPDITMVELAKAAATVTENVVDTASYGLAHPEVVADEFAKATVAVAREGTIATIKVIGDLFLR